MSEALETIPTPPAVELLGVVCAHDGADVQDPGDPGTYVTGKSGAIQVSSWHDDDGWCVVLTIEGVSTHAAVNRSSREAAAAEALEDALEVLDVLSRHSGALHQLRGRR